jgi:hypothetical protein
MGDLRNRVVGARLIKDGYSPYFYKYSPGDPIGYYDPQAFDIYKVSICTSTPFLHRLLIPLARLPFATIMRVWMVVLYLLYFGMAAYAFAIARDAGARVAVVVTALLFLLTNAWALHAKYGQTYLLIPALAMLTFALRRRPLAAGLAAAMLVMVRPNAALFLAPFLLMRELKWTFWIPAIVALAWVLLSPRERNLWRDYGTMVSEQVKIHQDLGPRRRPVWTDPGYKEWEGIDMDTVRARISRDPTRIYSENGNVFVLYRKMTGQRMPVAVLGLLGCFAVLVVAGALVVVRRKRGRPGERSPTNGRAGEAHWKPDPARLAIIGFCLYMISDLFSPIYRHAYYGVQWIMPLLIAASLYRSREAGLYYRRKSNLHHHRELLLYGGLLACLLLNIIHLPFVRMGNTIGEYGFLILLLIIGFAQRVDNVPREN